MLLIPKRPVVASFPTIDSGLNTVRLGLTGAYDVKFLVVRNPWHFIVSIGKGEKRRG